MHGPINRLSNMRENLDPLLKVKTDLKGGRAITDLHSLKTQLGWARVNDGKRKWRGKGVLGEVCQGMLFLTLLRESVRQRRKRNRVLLDIHKDGFNKTRAKGVKRDEEAEYDGTKEEDGVAPFRSDGRSQNTGRHNH